jgi:hypothetical protein
LPLKTSGLKIKAFVEERLNRLLNPPDSLVLLPVANVAPLKSILDVGPLLIGHYSEAFEQLLSKKSGTGFMQVSKRPWWQTGTDVISTSQSPIILACKGQVQLDKAVERAKLIFDDLTNLALMTQEDLDGLSLYSLRGDTNRPGIRGLVIDRTGLSKQIKNTPELEHEFYSTVVIDGFLGPHTTYHSYGEDPFPLENS